MSSQPTATAPLSQPASQHGAVAGPGESYDLGQVALQLGIRATDQSAPGTSHPAGDGAAMPLAQRSAVGTASADPSAQFVQYAAAYQPVFQPFGAQPGQNVTAGQAADEATLTEEQQRASYLQQSQQLQQQQVLAYYWQLYLQNALQQGGSTLPLPFMGAPFLPTDAFAAHFQQQQLQQQQQQQPQQQLQNGSHSPDSQHKKRGRDGEMQGGPKKGRKARNENKVCSNCGTTNTPFWRKDRVHGLPLCNACGLYYAKNESARPKVLWKQEGEGAQPVESPPRPGVVIQQLQPPVQSQAQPLLYSMHPQHCQEQLPPLQQQQQQDAPRITQQQHHEQPQGSAGAQNGNSRDQHTPDDAPTEPSQNGERPDLNVQPAAAPEPSADRKPSLLQQ